MNRVQRGKLIVIALTILTFVKRGYGTKHHEVRERNFW